MVATTVALPNIRRLFVPDLDKTIIEIDLQRAESQVVAWESGDDELKRIFQSGEDIHTSNATHLYDGAINYWRRDKAKRSIYAIQNGGKAKKIAEVCGIDLGRAQRFYDWFVGRHPKILAWHDRLIMSRLMRSYIQNIWGYRKHYYDRQNLPESERANMIREMVPWITQSTIGGTVDHMIVNLGEMPEVELLVQVHDSLVMQVPTARVIDLVPEIIQRSRIVVPYADPLIIPVTLQASPVSWGDVEEFPHDG